MQQHLLVRLKRSLDAWLRSGPVPQHWMVMRTSGHSLLTSLASRPRKRRKSLTVHNRIRNELKHNDRGDNEWVRADFEFEARDLIDRAIRNHWLAYDAPPHDRVIDNYVQLNWR